jgi:hypothetical protein
VARLRYELARLQDRRSVRAALAVGAIRRDGPGAALAALRGRGPRRDVPGPATVPVRRPLPQLRAVHTGPGHLLASTAVHERLTPEDAGTVLRRDRPDLLLIDDVQGWSASLLRELHELATEVGAATVTDDARAETALPRSALHLAREPADGPDGLGLPAVDAAIWQPVGLDDPRRERPLTPAEARTLDPAAARYQPVVALPAVADLGVRRCLELMAAGAVVVTGPDPDLERALGPVASTVVGPADTVFERAATLVDDSGLRRRVSVRLRRRVHAHHTTWRRLVDLASRLGFADPPSTRISVLLPTRRPDRVGQVLADLAAQHHPDVELVLLPHGDARLPDGLPPGTIVQRVPAHRPLGAVLDAGIDVATGAYVAKMDDDDRYGTDHLGDQLLAWRYSGATLVGRRVHGVHDEETDRTIHPPPGGEERWEDHLPGGTLLLAADDLRRLRWRHVPDAVDTELVRAVHLEGGSCYSAHRYGYVRVRHGDHTYDPKGNWAGIDRRGFDASLLEA